MTASPAIVVSVPRGLPRGPRAPMPLQTLRYGLDPYAFFASAQRAFGDVFTVRVMRDVWVVLADPGAVRQLYALGPEDVDSGVANRSLWPLLGTRSSLLLDGDEHLRRRRLVLPPFHGQRMRAYEGLIRAATRAEMAAWPAGVPVRTLERMQAITLRVVLQAVFGVSDGPAVERLAASLRRLLTWTTDPWRGLVFGLLGPDRLAALRGFQRQRGEVDVQLHAEITARRQATDLTSRADILSLLLAARDPDGHGLSDAELRDELMTLLVAGYETTAAALSWALLEVAAHPAAQARLAAGEPGLAESAISETLRLHPPLAIFGFRRLRRPLEFAGRALPAGTTVAPCATLLHRRADVYEQPTRWRIDRFLNARPPAGAWVAFGGGVRRCPGAALARFEARIVLDELLGALELCPAGPRPRSVARRGIVVVPPRGGAIIASPRA